MENYKELLIALYKEHAPEKVDQIDFYLDKYKGKEKQFYITQKAKYANKNSVTDSKKILAEAMARIKKQGDDAKNKKAEAKASIEKKEEKPITPEAVQPEKSKPAKAREKKPVEPILKEETLKKVEDQKKEDIPVVKEIAETTKKEDKIIADAKKEHTKAINLDKETVKETPPKETVSNTKKEAPSVIINPPIKKGAYKEKPEIIAEPKAANTKDPKKETNPDLSWEEEKKKFHIHKSSYQEKEKRRIPAILYFGLAALIIFIVAVIIWFFHFRDPIHQKEEPLNVQKVKVEKKEDLEESQAKKETQEQAKFEETEAQSTAEKSKPKATPKPQKQNKPAQTKPTAERLYNKDIRKPAIFVACYAVKQERLAQKKVAQLKEYNLDAHYYWIPDIVANGNSFFKVVVGPFSNIRDAYPSLTTTQERVNFDAYILVVD